MVRSVPVLPYVRLPKLALFWLPGWGPFRLASMSWLFAAIIVLLVTLATVPGFKPVDPTTLVAQSVTTLHAPALRLEAFPVVGHTSAECGADCLAGLVAEHSTGAVFEMSRDYPESRTSRAWLWQLPPSPRPPRAIA